MDIAYSDISCGIQQLSDVGQHPNRSDFDYAMAEFAENLGCMIVASVPTTWLSSINFLKSIGFKQIGRTQRNPNSGNKIVLFSRNITAKERAHYRALNRKLYGNDY